MRSSILIPTFLIATASIGHASENCSRVTAGGNISGYVIDKNCTEADANRLIKAEKKASDASSALARQGIAPDAMVFGVESEGSGWGGGWSSGLAKTLFELPLPPERLRWATELTAANLLAAVKTAELAPAQTDMFSIVTVIGLVNHDGKRSFLIIGGNPFGKPAAAMGEIITKGATTDLFRVDVAPWADAIKPFLPR